jgi:uncharacterized integral membrane protein
MAAAHRGYRVAMSDHSKVDVTARGIGGIVRVTIVALIIAAVILIAADNRDDVRIGYVTGSADAPLWLVLVIAGVAGVIVGWLLRHRPRHR